MPCHVADVLARTRMPNRAAEPTDITSKRTQVEAQYACSTNAWNGPDSSHAVVPQDNILSVACLKERDSHLLYHLLGLAEVPENSSKQSAGHEKPSPSQSCSQLTTSTKVLTLAVRSQLRAAIAARKHSREHVRAGTHPPCTACRSASERVRRPSRRMASIACACAARHEQARPISLSAPVQPNQNARSIRSFTRRVRKGRCCAEKPNDAKLPLTRHCVRSTCAASAICSNEISSASATSLAACRAQPKGLQRLWPPSNE
eukprot:1633486-Pleurochrysis_carterae.AAC.1